MTPSSPSDPIEVATYSAMAAALVNATGTRVDKPWGHELIVDMGGWLLKVITVLDRHQTSLQSHEIKRETIFVLDSVGVGGVYIYVPVHPRNIEQIGDTVQSVVKMGDVITIEPGQVHRSIGPVTLLEVTTPENWDVVRWSDSYGRGMTL